ncbi:DNA-processing protein DprA [Nocardioides sp. Bht2]|uniref:DNA-processing protein DprA n=1 Tax=Nocardioides sp. Bht2 TaxID=3392297 RepID=UPI0039B37CCB
MSATNEEERLIRVALSLMAEPGDPKLCELAAELGPEQLYRRLADPATDEPRAVDVATRLSTSDPGRALEQAQRRGIRFVMPGDTEWPSGVEDLAHAGVLSDRGGVPLGLWARGPVPLHELGVSAAVVGARSATSYGTTSAARIAADLARAGAAVVSGAAFGIDEAGHRGALSVGGITVAVLACGVDRVYPAAHRQLLNHLADHGAVISEAAPGWAPMRVRFLARNRIIAALARGTLVVEAATRSGALNTARWATQLNRPTMAVPGSVTSASSEGCHRLIRDGGACLVTGADDVLELISDSGRLPPQPEPEPSRPRDRLSLRERQVLDAVPAARTARAESIARTAGIGLSEVVHLLGRLQEQGFVDGLDGRWCLSRWARRVP